MDARERMSPRDQVRRLCRVDRRFLTLMGANLSRQSRTASLRPDGGLRVLAEDPPACAMVLLYHRAAIGTPGAKVCPLISLPTVLLHACPVLMRVRLIRSQLRVTDLNRFAVAAISGPRTTLDGAYFKDLLVFDKNSLSGKSPPTHPCTILYHHATCSRFLSAGEPRACPTQSLGVQMWSLCSSHA